MDDFADTVPSSQMDEIVVLVARYPIYRALLHELRLLPERTMSDPLMWNLTVTIVLYLEALRVELS